MREAIGPNYFMCVFMCVRVASMCVRACVRARFVLDSQACFSEKGSLRGYLNQKYLYLQFNFCDSIGNVLKIEDLMIIHALAACRESPVFLSHVPG